VLYIHGGGYNYGTPALYRDLTWRIADVARATVTLPVYRLAPEHSFPAALDDVIASYHSLLSEDIDPRRLALIGDSAGGGLVFAMLLCLRDAGTPLPAATVAISPWVDLSLQSESSISFGRTDPMLSLAEARHLAANYLGSTAPNHPHASPIFGDVSGVPPSLIQVGDDEMLRDDAVTMAERLRAAGCDVELELWPRMPHVWHTLARLVPEGRRAIERIGAFLHRTWAQAGM
jgi:acetyl esterase/lipase